ncbi:MAG TPA: peroxiredoxin [Propionibacteriaceae bacterium]|nr:peroxiredoxin [Propionibacteriaceae bacterium]
MTEVGQPAPDFRTRNQHGESVSRADLLGAPAVLVFYPWAFSGICRGELAALREDHDRFVGLGVRVLGVSCDAMFTLRAYADAEALPFDLLTDHWPHGAIAQAYGIFDDRAGCALRATFVLDAEGVVTWRVVNGIGEAREMADLVAALVA